MAKRELQTYHYYASYVNKNVCGWQRVTDHLLSLEEAIAKTGAVKDQGFAVHEVDHLTGKATRKWKGAQLIMTEDAEKELERLERTFERWLHSAGFENRICEIINQTRNETFIKRSEYWIGRLPFFGLGFLCALSAVELLRAHH